MEVWKMALVIREAVEDDAESIYLLNLNALGYDYPIEHTKQRVVHILGSNARLLVAELDGVVAGYIHAEDYDCAYCEPLKNILALAVDGHFRKMGIGRALISEVENWARETGASGIRLTSGMQRTDAHRFYEACGYVCRKDCKNFVKQLTEEFSLSKRL